MNYSLTFHYCLSQSYIHLQYCCYHLAPNYNWVYQLILFLPKTTMEILGPKICTKHNMEAHKICSNSECFLEKDILVCPNCSSKHLTRHCEVIEVSLLNQKVHELMKKRVDFQFTYQTACDEWLTQFKKFKIFKEEIMNALNLRERQLNDVCRKIRRTIPYEKDRNLFKKTLSCLYLSTRGINLNYDLYRKFNDLLAQTINECNRAIHKLRINRLQIPTFLKKEHQICAIIKECGESSERSVTAIRYCDPVFSQFKKETIKYPKLVQAEHVDSKLYRISDEDFISYNTRSKVVNLYNYRNLALPKTLYVGCEAQHIEVIGKNLFLTNQQNGIYVYDLLNQKVLKQYTSSNHRQAKITALLALNRSHVLNFISNPNQIVSLHFDEAKETLKVARGIDTKSKCLTAELFGDSFIASFEDKTLKIFKSQNFEKEADYQFENSSVKSIAVMDNQTLLVGGQSQFVYLLDKRAQGIVGKFNMQTNCSQIKKIYPTSIVANLGSCLKLYEYRMQKQLTKLTLDSPVKYIEVLNSLAFVTSGKALSYYQGIP